MVHTPKVCTWATGTDLETIRALMGHKHGSPLVLRYQHTDETRIKDAMRKAFDA